MSPIDEDQAEGRKGMVAWTPPNSHMGLGTILLLRQPTKPMTRESALKWRIRLKSNALTSER